MSLYSCGELGCDLHNPREPMNGVGKASETSLLRTLVTLTSILGRIIRYGSAVKQIEVTRMDDIARDFFRLHFENAFLKKRGNEFEDWFATIMEKRHPEDFMRCRPWGQLGDRKNDGYLKSERTLFQVYAPNELKASAAVSKIEEDFKGALPFWQEYFDRWIFVHNSQQGLSPLVIEKLLELDKAHKPSVGHWGYEELRRKAFELNEDDLSFLLGPPPTRKIMLDLGLETLVPVLEQVASLPVLPEPDLRPPPADKISRNMLSEHVASLLKIGMMRADLVRKYFRLSPNRQDEVAESFRRRYESLRAQGLRPDDIFVELQRYAGGSEVPSAARQGAVLAVLAFFFEECDIFERDQLSESTP